MVHVICSKFWPADKHVIRLPLLWDLITMVKARPLQAPIYAKLHISLTDMVVKTHTQGTAQEEFLHILQPSPKSLSLFITKFL